MSTPTRFAEIPVVDVSALFAGSPEELAQVAGELGEAARNVGFLYISGTGVPEATFVDLLAVTQRFFALPLAEKMRVFIGDSSNHRGYVPQGEEVFIGGTADVKEAFDLALDLPADDVDWLAGTPMLGPNRWPVLPGFREAATSYYQEVMALGRVVLRGFALALGEQPEVFDKFVTKPPSQLRLLHYPQAPSAEDVVGIGAHTDYECFTLLKPTAPGLEVLNGAGEWIDVPPLEGTYVLNIGDMLELWTNGEFVATTHRVRKVKEERWSFPLFFNVDYNTRVAPLPRFVRNGKPALPALVAGEHLWAQTVQSFTYLKRRLAAGDISLPDASFALASFGARADDPGQ